MKTLYKRLGALLYLDENLILKVGVSVLAGVLAEEIKKAESVSTSTGVEERGQIFINLGFLVGRDLHEPIRNLKELVGLIKNMHPIEILLNVMNAVIRIQRDALISLYRKRKSILSPYLQGDLITSIYTGYLLPSFLSRSKREKYNIEKLKMRGSIMTFHSVHIFCGSLDLVKPGRTLKDVQIVTLPGGRFLLGRIWDIDKFHEMSQKRIQRMIEAIEHEKERYQEKLENIDFSRPKKEDLKYYVRVLIPEEALYNIHKDDIEVVALGIIEKHEPYIITKMGEREKESMTLDEYIRVIALFDATDVKESDLLFAEVLEYEKLELLEWLL